MQSQALFPLCEEITAHDSRQRRNPREFACRLDVARHTNNMISARVEVEVENVRR